MVLNNLTPLAGLTFRRHHIPHAHAWGYTLLPLRGANRMRFARYFRQLWSVTGAQSNTSGQENVMMTFRPPLGRMISL